MQTAELLTKPQNVFEMEEKTEAVEVTLSRGIFGH